jgi:hypothetical protein
MMKFVMNISTYGRNREMEEDTWCDGEPYKDDGNMVIAEMIMLLKKYDDDTNDNVVGDNDDEDRIDNNEPGLCRLVKNTSKRSPT